MQVFLMGMTVSREYEQVTLSGDMCQKLHENGLRDYTHALPFVSRARRNARVFLDINFKQRDCLAALSASFRTFIQTDVPIKVESPAAFPPAEIHLFKSPDDIAKVILSRIRKLPLQATTAVILPHPQASLHSTRWHHCRARLRLAADIRPLTNLRTTTGPPLQPLMLKPNGGFATLLLAAKVVSGS
jgi:hypothetical protein